MEHVQTKEVPQLCRKLESNEVRCPFCENDIALLGIDVKEAWHDHLMNKCKQNARRSQK